jgi:hypothetical protein
MLSDIYTEFSFATLSALSVKVSEAYEVARNAVENYPYSTGLHLLTGGFFRHTGVILSR